jgi:hypothetical protein
MLLACSMYGVINGCKISVGKLVRLRPGRANLFESACPISIIFGKILSRAHGSFEQQMGSWRLSSLLSSITGCYNYYILLLLKIITGRTE